jgi:branched-subunit amino acid transport protein
VSAYTAGDLALLLAGLVIVTLVARNLFLVLPPRWQPRGWVAQALQVAPLAALLAITVPEIARDVSPSPTTWLDARLLAAAVLAAAIAAGLRGPWALALGAAVFVGLSRVLAD